MENNITIASYNIWFDKIHLSERTSSLIRSLNLLKPDIICLQEVRQEIYDVLIEHLTDYHYYFPKKINRDYGCVIFSKYPIVKSVNIDYETSNMGRGLTIIKIDYPYYCKSSEICKVEIVVANSHFESLFKKLILNGEKIKQYKFASEKLGKLYDIYKNVILCSDTNVMEHEENKFDEFFIDKGWVDAWKMKGIEDNKCTYDSENNMHLKAEINKYKSRIDRILAKSNNCIMEEFSIIKSNDVYMEPSDHFGIFCKFSVITDEIQKS